MTAAELEMFARANAQALGLTLDDAQIAAVAAQLAILFEHAHNISEVDLPAGLEPLTVFEP